MTRRPKRTLNSGSALLGAELRRLRGIRTLDEIAALSAAPPLAGSVPPISMSTISDVETGKQMPKLLTLYSFSMVYRVSMNQLLGYVVEEGLAKAATEVTRDASEDPAVTFGRLLSIGEWHRALPLALHCERNAKTERERMAWRSNRAACFSKVGLHSEAVALLSSCLESPDVSRRQEFVILQLLADVQAASGNFKLATFLAKEALEHASDDASPSEVANLEFIRAQLIVAVQDDVVAVDERLVREAMRLADRAEKLWKDDDVAQLRVRGVRAQCYRLLGNRLVAARDLEQIISESADRKYSVMEARAALELARVRRESGHATQALALLDRARSVGEAAQQIDVIFEANFALFLALRNDRPEVAVVHFRRCREVLALMPTSARSVKAFERVAREMTA